MDFGLSGKFATVLASTRGLGLGIATSLAREGADVLLTGRDESKLQRAVADINAMGAGRASFIAADLKSPDDLEALIAASEARNTDILVNNTGGPPAMPAASVAEAHWHDSLDSMLIPVTTITNRLLPGMRTRGWGRIVTVASSGVVQPIPNLALSNGVRAALVGWSKTLSAEVAADGVTVNVLIPGRIHTDRVDELDGLAAAKAGKSVEEVARQSKATIPAGRYGTVDEFASVAAFICSAQASYVTGATIRVDGGLIRSI